MERKSTNNFLGCLPKAVTRNLFIGAAVLVLGIIFGGPKIYISLNTATILFCILLVPYIALTWWSIWALAKGGQNGALVTNGPYSLVRNPMYGAIIFILNPALAILFRSWLLVLAIIPVYFSWRQCVAKEEAGALAQKFGVEHAEYMKTTPRFFPDLRRLNPVLFYGAAGLLIFLVSFIFVNSSALYLRWVAFEVNGKISYDEPTPEKIIFPVISSQPIFDQPTAGQLPPSLPISDPIGANYNDSDDAIIISKLGIRAPLISSVTGTSQKELNDGLNQGVILYPGSSLPGQNGEVVLSGHSSIFPWVKTQYGQVFTLLDKLQAGDTVSLVYNHRQYDYQITGQEILNPSQVKISATNEPVLKMTTCWPVGTSAKRLVVYGELVR